MTEFKELERAVTSLGKSIADFPVGADSINDRKPTEEKIQDLRESLKGLNTRILMLKARAETRKLSGLAESNVQETHTELQDGIAQLTMNYKAVETCLHQTGTLKILASSEDTEINQKLKTMMRKLFTLMDTIVNLDAARSIEIAKETELKLQLQESLSEFQHFLKEQKNVRDKKLEQTNPEIARQKESMQDKLQRINIMKRMITNFIGASCDLVKDNEQLKEFQAKHRELVDLETVVKMAQEIGSEKS